MNGISSIRRRLVRLEDHSCQDRASFDRVTTPADLVSDDRVVHLDAVLAARAALPPVKTPNRRVALFAAIGDPTRARILGALAVSELCACDLVATVCQSESAVSHQHRHLRSLGLVGSRRHGRPVYYALADDHVRQLLAQGPDHVAHHRGIAL